MLISKAYLTVLSFGAAVFAFGAVAAPVGPTLTPGVYRDLDVLHCDFRVSYEQASGHLILQAIKDADHSLSTCEAKYEFAPNESQAGVYQQLNTAPETRAQYPYLDLLLNIIDNKSFVTGKLDASGSRLTEVTAFGYGHLTATKAIAALSQVVDQCRSYMNGELSNTSALEQSLRARFQVLSQRNCEVITTKQALTVDTYKKYFSAVAQAEAVRARAKKSGHARRGGRSSNYGELDPYTSCVLTRASDAMMALQRGGMVPSYNCAP